MKLVAAMLPSDVAVYLESVQAQLAGLEELPREALEERLAQTRAWLAKSASSLREADARGKTPAQASTVAREGAPEGFEASRTGSSIPKKPCGCDGQAKADEQLRRFSARIRPGHNPSDEIAREISWRAIGGMVARKLFER